MMQQTGVFWASVCAMTVSVTMVAFAQDDKPATPAAETTPSNADQKSAKLFDPLFRLFNCQGSCEVNNPDVKAFQPALSNKAYPMGTVVRTGAGGGVIVAFSAQESLQVLENSEVLVGVPENCPDGRLVCLHSGKIKTTFRDNLPEGSISVQTPNTVCKNIAGRGEFSLETDANVETFQVATITGSMFVEGQQYNIPALRAANTVNIQTAVDRSLSRLVSISGDFNIVLANGTDAPVTYGMSPKAVVKIWRENAPVGGRPIISTLVVSPTGKACHRFAYADGRPNLATGELIAVQESEEKAKEDLPVLLSKEGEADKGAPVQKEADKQ